MTIPMTVDILLNGVKRTVSKQELFDLAAKGMINPETPITINGKLATAGKVKGIIFRQPRATAVPIPFAQSAAPQVHAGFTPLPQQPFQQETVPCYAPYQSGQTPVPVPGLDWRQQQDQDKQPQSESTAEKTQERRDVLGKILGGLGIVVAGIVGRTLPRLLRERKAKERR